VSNDFQMLNVDSALLYTFDFSDEIIPPATLTSVTFSQEGTGLTLGGQLDDLNNYLSSIRLSGAVHGRTYCIQALGVTSTGESIVKDLKLIGFNA
jgi:hypothetical protein